MFNEFTELLIKAVAMNLSIFCLPQFSLQMINPNS